MFLTESSEVASAWQAVASLPSCLMRLTVSSADSRDRSATRTRAPSRASRMAVARPLPIVSPAIWPPPTTMATLPSTRPLRFTAMQITRLYTGEDQQTHIEWITISEHPELGSLQPATGIAFRVAEPGHFIDWHGAPRRQYVITLAGEVE